MLSGAATPREQPARRGLRRSERRGRVMRIRVYGTSLGGRTFTEDGVSVRVSRHGAQVRLKHLLMVGDSLIILNPRNNREATFRVVDQVTDPPGIPYADWGMECLELNENIWDL